jgi:phage protein D
VEDSATVHEQLVQMNQSDIDFLFSRARATGFELLVDDKTLHFRKLRHDRGTALTLDFTHGLISFEGYLSTSEQVGQVTVHGNHPESLEAIVGMARAGDVAATMGGAQTGPAATDGLFGARTLTITDQPVASQAEADQLARSILEEIALGYITGEVTANGNPSIRVGSVVELTGLGRRFSGSYYVIRVRHVWDGQFLTHLQVRRNAS